MKKIITFILAVALIATLGITAFAVTPSVTPAGSTANGSTTTALPTVVNAEEDDDDIIVSEESKFVTEAHAKLDDIKPEGASVRYLFDVASKSGAAEKDWDLTLKIEVPEGKTVTAALWNGSEWVELVVVDNNDGTYTIKGDRFGAVAIFVK